MIVGYRGKNTERFAHGEFVRAFQGFAKQAGKRLAIIDAATSLNDLRGLPSNRLEALIGDRQGQYSLRIIMRYRVCFVRPDAAPGPSNVEITDHYD